jgi:hypothetical protein
LTDRLSLSAHDLRVSPACLGMTADPAAVHRAFELGVNFFFVTVDMHWPLYEPLREGLRTLLARGRARREDIVVAGVSYVAQPEFGWSPFEELVNEIPGLDHVDVLVVGGAYAADVDARLDQRREQVAQGFVGARALGVTLHDRKSAARIANEALADLVLGRFNPAHPGARVDVFPELRESRALLFSFLSQYGRALENDRERLGLDPRFWLPEAADYYRFALRHRELDGILCAPSTPAEITALDRALAKGPLSDDEYNHLVRLADLSLGRTRLRRAER